MKSSSTPHGAWVALALLAGINFMNYYDRLLVVVVSQPLRLEFNMTDTQYGLLTGPAFVFVYAVASLLFGLLADRQNRRRLIGVAVGLWSAMTALCGMAGSFPMLALARAGIGVGEGGANPAGMSLLSDHFPAQKRSMALALFQVGGMFGMLASFMLASWITTKYDWRTTFLVAAVPGLLLAAATFFFMPEPKRGQQGEAASAPLPFFKTLGVLWQNKAYRWLSAAASFGVFSSLGMLIWLPQFFIRMHGMDQSHVGFLFGPAAALGLIAGMLLGGVLGNTAARHSLASPVRICIAANLLLAPVLLTVLWIPSTNIALIACFVGMALAVIYAPAFQATMQSVCKPEQRGTAGACSNVLNAIIGQGLIPLFVGALSDALMPTHGIESLRLALTASVGFTVISGLLFIVAYLTTRKQFGTNADPAVTPAGAIPAAVK